MTYKHTDERVSAHVMHNEVTVTVLRNESALSSTKSVHFFLSLYSRIASAKNEPHINDLFKFLHLTHNWGLAEM